MSERRLDEFKPQGLANTAWAFAKVKLFDEKLFILLAQETGPQGSPAHQLGPLRGAWLSCLPLNAVAFQPRAVVIENSEVAPLPIPLAAHIPGMQIGRHDLEYRCHRQRQQYPQKAE